MMKASAILCVLALTACGGGGSDGGDDEGVSLNDGGSYDNDGGSGGGGGGNIGLGGAGDFGYFRELLENNMVPTAEDFDAAGFFHEHHIQLPPPTCGQRVCVQTMLGAIHGLFGDGPMAMLHLGLNTPVTIDPDTRPPLTLAVVVDTSGSMNVGNKMEYVRQGLVTLISGLEDTDLVAIIEYSDAASVVAPMGPVAGRRGTLIDLAQGLTAGGGTNLYGGLARGYQEIMAAFDPERLHRTIMLSDGVPTAGNTSEPAIMAMSASYNAQGLGITTIGLGTDFNASLMRGLAEQGNGNHYFLEDSTAVEEVFIEELSYFAIPVAYDVTLAVQQGSHYDFGQAFGSSFWVDAADGGQVHVPSVFIAHRLDDGDVFPGNDGGVVGRRGGGSALLVRLAPASPLPPPDAGNQAVAVVDISFREPGGTELITDQVTVTHPYWADGPPPAGHFSSDDPASTHKVLVILEAYRAIEIACIKFHTNLATSGLATLLRVQAAMLDYNQELADVDVQHDLDLIARLIEVMIANGAEPPDDAGIPADPWPVD